MTASQECGHGRVMGYGAQVRAESGIKRQGSEGRPRGVLQQRVHLTDLQPQQVAILITDATGVFWKRRARGGSVAPSRG